MGQGKKTRRGGARQNRQEEVEQGKCQDKVLQGKKTRQDKNQIINTRQGRGRQKDKRGQGKQKDNTRQSKAKRQGKKAEQVKAKHKTRQRKARLG